MNRWEWVWILFAFAFGTLHAMLHVIGYILNDGIFLNDGGDIFPWPGGIGQFHLLGAGLPQLALLRLFIKERWHK